MHVFVIYGLSSRIKPAKRDLREYMVYWYTIYIFANAFTYFHHYMMRGTRTYKNESTFGSTWRGEYNRGTWKTSGSLMIVSKLISAIQRVVFLRSFFEILPQTFHPRFRRRIWAARSHLLHLREFTRIYEMLKLEVTYSRSRIVSTSRGGIKKKKRRKGIRRNGKTSPALTIFSSRRAHYVYSVAVINFHDAHNPQLGISSFVLYLTVHFFSPSSFFSLVLPVYFTVVRKRWREKTRDICLTAQLISIGEYNWKLDT